MSMVGLVETPGLPLPGLGFSVSHQRVELDIDVVSRSLKGKIEITINPHTKELKTVRLNCRQCEVKRLSINGKPASSLRYEDPYARMKLSWQAGVNQHHMLRERVEGQLKNPPEEELIVNLPKSIRIDELDPFSVEAQNLLLAKSLGSTKRDSGDRSVLDLVQNSRIAVEQTARFTPITLHVDFVIKRIRDGMQFVGWEKDDLRYPHAYSTNSQSPGTACCLFPCVDDLTSRCTWEISIKCPKTIGDALERRLPSITELHRNGNAAATYDVDGNRHMPGADSTLPKFSDEDKALDLAVVCSGEMTDEIIDPSDPSRKTTSFICSTAVAPQHIGFAIGPFEHVDLADFRESDEDDKLGQNAVPLHGFCLPGRTEELKNTCLPMAKAIDFFTLTYGSYPFTSYKLCFVEDLYSDILHTASLSLCSNRLLFPEDIVEPLDRVTRQLVHALAFQWMGVNVIPKEMTDMWVVIGIAYFITDVFMKKLSGNNEYRYHHKQASDRISDMDIARPSIYDTGPIISLDSSELDFMAIKAPLVLFILDRRLAKASGSSGLSRIISRVFLNAKVGDLANGAISTAYFMRTCEKLGHTKLDTFFAQWVFGAGCPRFRVTQRFNKKKLVVEMLIQQVQGEASGDRDLEKETFIRDVKEEIHGVYAGPVQPVFTGPMTIRIHEADGTPYEHIVEIKEVTTKFDIPYNTKYKRLKRSRRQKERNAAGVGNDLLADGQDDVLLYSLGDVLQTEEEINDWRLVDWSKEDEGRMSQESYEWIRMDADFEWICKMSITMPGYMYLSQLQQDRDVVAQLESVQYMAAQREHPLVSTILVRTLMDRRYFHGIRTAAAAALTRHAKDELNWVGLHHLEKAFQEFFCFPGSPMTRSNDFSDRAAYYIQCAIPQAIAKVRDNNGKAPLRARNFLLEKLKFNDNSNNHFSDCHYLAILMTSLAEALSSTTAPSIDAFDMTDDNEDDSHFHYACLDEIDRHRRIDEWISSYHNILSITALDCKRKLAKAGVIATNIADILQYTRDGTLEDLRLNAFSNLMDLDMARNSAILRLFLCVLSTDPSSYIRDNMLRLFGKALGGIAIGESSSSVSIVTQQDGLIIEQESSTEARQADLARKQTVVGAIAALKDELGPDPVLRKALWEAATSPVIGLREMGDLLEICSLLYTPESSMMVSLKLPRYWTCKQTRKVSISPPSSPHPSPNPPPTEMVRAHTQGTFTFSHSSKFRTTPRPPSHQRSSGTAASSPASLRHENSGPSPALPPAPRTFLKPPKKPPVSVPSATAATVVSSSPSHQGAEGLTPKPRLTLKLSLKGAGARSPPAPPG